MQVKFSIFTVMAAVIRTLSEGKSQQLQGSHLASLCAPSAQLRGSEKSGVHVKMHHNHTIIMTGIVTTTSLQVNYRDFPR